MGDAEGGIAVGGAAGDGSGDKGGRQGGAGGLLADDVYFAVAQDDSGVVLSDKAFIRLDGGVVLGDKAFIRCNGGVGIAVILTKRSVGKNLRGDILGRSFLVIPGERSERTDLRSFAFAQDNSGVGIAVILTKRSVGKNLHRIRLGAEVRSRRVRGFLQQHHRQHGRGRTGKRPHPGEARSFGGKAGLDRLPQPLRRRLSIFLHLPTEFIVPFISHSFCIL